MPTNQILRSNIYAKRLGLIEKVHRILEDERCYLDPNFNISQLAQKLGTNRSYTSSLFKNELGTSFNHFINNFRVVKAETLLRNLAIPMKDVWRNAGFGSSASFRRAFQLKNNLSPSEYRLLYGIEPPFSPAK